VIFCVAGVAAFHAPSPVSRSRATVVDAGTADLGTMAGVSVECGGKVFDPLALAQWRDVEELRDAEIANGRSAMLACVGWLWPQFFGLWHSGPVTTADPVAAIAQVPMLAWIQIIVGIGVLEAAKVNWRQGIERDSSKPFFDPAGLWPKDAASQKIMQDKELKNGRMAMIAFSGLVVHHFMPGAVPLLGTLM